MPNLQQQYELITKTYELLTMPNLQEKTNYYYCMIVFYIKPFVTVNEHIPVNITYTDESKIFQNLYDIIDKIIKEEMEKNPLYKSAKLEILTKLN